MTPFRRFWALSALALTLVLGACSTAPNDPTLEPQFGTLEGDVGVDVAYASTGNVFVLSEREGEEYDAYEDESYYYDEISLQRYDSGGALRWTRQIGSSSCSSWNYYCLDESVEAYALAADTRGYSYALISYSGVAHDCSTIISRYIYKYDASGKLVRTFELGHGGDPLSTVTGAEFADVANLAVDGSGNVYVVRQNADFDEDYCDAHLSNVVAKYSTNGSLSWQRSSTVGTLYGVSVSGRGDVYVAGSTGVAKYTNSGNLVWTKSGEAFEVASSGTNVYLRNYKTPTVRKLDANGRQLWSKTQTGLNNIVIGAMTADANGNVYLTGKYNASSSNRNIFTRKLNSSGRVLWTKTFGTSAYDDARGVATLNGSEIYLTGSTQGALAHPFRGGENDGYVAKLSSSGSTAWKR